jgi:predicted permease
MNSRATTTTSNEVAPLLPVLPTHVSGDEQNQRGISWENYVLAVEKYPIRTKCLTALILFVASDAFAQVLEFIFDDDGATRGIFYYDWIRAMRFGAVGLLGAPWSHYYFYWLDHYLPPSSEPFTKRTALKVFIDQFVQAPILLAIMIFALSLMKRKGLDAAKEDLSRTFMKSLIANCEFHSP